MRGDGPSTAVGSAESAVVVAGALTSKSRGPKTTTWVQQQTQLSAPGCELLSLGKPKLSHRSGAIASQANSSIPMRSRNPTAVSRYMSERFTNPIVSHI